MGYDNETRKCIICGKEYVCNKYSKSRTCSKECSGKLRHLRKNKKNS
nr:MAG TPA: putative ATP-dependent RNA helicase [Caudoviricetes sp.]